MDILRPISAIAESAEVDCTSLRARSQIALMAQGKRDETDTATIIIREAARLRRGHEMVEHLFVTANARPPTDLSAARLILLPEDIGIAISSAVHYLGSPRADGEHFGLVDPQRGRLIAYSALNKQDWDLILSGLRPLTKKTTEFLSLSRVYVPRMAPRNTVSKMLSQLTRYLSHAGRSSLITTAVDQNLGFSGVSYQASGWFKLFSIPHLGYLYVDGCFRTRRELIRQFGTDDPRDLVDQLKARMAATGPLPRDTLIFATATDPDVRRSLQHAACTRLLRSSEEVTT